MAGRTFPHHRFVPKGEFAIRIVVATVKDFSTAGSLFDKIAAVFRALHIEGLRFDVLAVRVVAARDERTVLALLHHQFVAALRALFTGHFNGAPSFACFAVRVAVNLHSG